MENIDKTYFSSVTLSSANSNENTLYEELEIYLADHPKVGYLTFQVFQESPLQGTIPVPNARIMVSKKLGESYFVSKVLTTNMDGKTDPISLPTVSASLSRKPPEGEVSASYSASVSAPNFLRKKIKDIPIFEGITAIQPVNLIPDIDYDAVEYKNRPKK